MRKCTEKVKWSMKMVIFTMVSSKMDITREKEGISGPQDRYFRGCTKKARNTDSE